MGACITGIYHGPRSANPNNPIHDPIPSSSLEPNPVTGMPPSRHLSSSHTTSSTHFSIHFASPSTKIRVSRSLSLTLTLGGTVDVLSLSLTLTLGGTVDLNELIVAVETFMTTPLGEHFQKVPPIEP